ncbi:MAG: type II toxin-antitoxin system RelE/ParE family toxin [Planctomycetes bacterium]|nr:type II toxin-antitoxin system RelE/ParE family toxin [Planctomycetota bacterium]
MSIVYAGAALADLDQIEDDLRQVGIHVLQLFHRRLSRALALRERLPLSAPEYQPPDPRLPGMRYFPIRRFESFAVFYQPTDDGIRVVRVLHTSRNIAVIFAPDP